MKTLIAEPRPDDAEKAPESMRRGRVADAGRGPLCRAEPAANAAGLKMVQVQAERPVRLAPGSANAFLVTLQRAPLT